MSRSGSQSGSFHTQSGSFHSQPPRDEHQPSRLFHASTSGQANLRAPSAQYTGSLGHHPTHVPQYAHSARQPTHPQYPNPALTHADRHNLGTMHPAPTFSPAPIQNDPLPHPYPLLPRSGPYSSLAGAIGTPSLVHRHLAQNIHAQSPSAGGAVRRAMSTTSPRGHYEQRPKKYHRSQPSALHDGPSVSSHRRTSSERFATPGLFEGVGGLPFLQNEFRQACRLSGSLNSKLICELQDVNPNPDWRGPASHVSDTSIFLPTGNQFEQIHRSAPELQPRVSI